MIISRASVKYSAQDIQIVISILAPIHMQLVAMYNYSHACLLSTHDAHKVLGPIGFLYIFIGVKWQPNVA